MSNTGFIYIMTNPSFPEYVKIGYKVTKRQREKQPAGVYHFGAFSMGYVSFWRSFT